MIAPRTGIERHFAWTKRYFGLKYFQCFGQPTATSTALTLVGNANTVGMVDAAIDQVGSWYADGKIGGVYDLFGITGKAFSVGTYFSIQFGDK